LSCLDDFSAPSAATAAEYADISIAKERAFAAVRLSERSAKRGALGSPKFAVPLHRRSSPRTKRRVRTKRPQRVAWLIRHLELWNGHPFTEKLALTVVNQMKADGLIADTTWPADVNVQKQLNAARLTLAKRSSHR
jgi:hypothetical protein